MAIVPTLKNWQVNVASETPAGFMMVGHQGISLNRTRLVVISTDSAGNTHWTRTYPQLKGLVAGYGVTAADSQQILVTGVQNGIAKLWSIDSKSRGDIKWSMDLDSGIARSVKVMPDGRFIIAVEKDNQLSVNCLNSKGKFNWRRKFSNIAKAKSSLLAAREGYLVLSYGSHGLALDPFGHTFWEYHDKTAQWQGVCQRNNGEILFFGRQTAQMFGPLNEDAYLMAVRPLSKQFVWFRTYGSDTAHDRCISVTERPNGQLMVLAKQDRRFRLLELNQNYTMSKQRWLTDSIITEKYRPISLLNQSAWQDKWLIAYNRSDGTVWLQPTRQTLSTEKEATHLQFSLRLTDAVGKPIVIKPITDVPVTYQLPASPPEIGFIHFNQCVGEGYAYLLSRTDEDGQWHEKGWIHLGSCDSLEVSFYASRYILLIAGRPYAVPVRLLLDSDAYAADSLVPDNPAESLSEQYPTSFGSKLKVNVSDDGKCFEVKNLPPEGWIPIVLNPAPKVISSKR
ncbi:MAG: hypothetical protein U0X91_27835 [Spirosomataceae bacterium]